MFVRENLLKKEGHSCPAFIPFRRLEALGIVPNSRFDEGKDQNRVIDIDHIDRTGTEGWILSNQFPSVVIPSVRSSWVNTTRLGYPTLLTYQKYRTLTRLFVLFNFSLILKYILDGRPRV